MKRRAGMMFAGALLALGLWSMTAYSADDDDETKAIKEAQQDVIKLMDSIKGKKGDVKAQAQAMKKKYEELKPIMWVYKPRKANGIGMDKDGAGIESELARLGGTKSNPAKVAQKKKEIAKAADLSRAIAEVTELYVPKKNAAKWQGYVKDMKKASDELKKAAEDGDGAKIKKAINNLNASCTDCHGEFRND
jgi:cytochrome c556